MTRPSAGELVGGLAGHGRRAAVVAVALLLVTMASGTGLPAGVRSGVDAAVSGDHSGVRVDEGAGVGGDVESAGTSGDAEDAGVGGSRVAAGSTEWHDYRTVVVFRDDDPQPDYQFETLRAVDQVFVEEGVPVAHAVVVAPDGEAVDPDGRFCRYLGEQGREQPDLFEYALHGYTHRPETDFGGGSEFGGLPADEQRRRIADGTATLTACVGERPRTFVPPLNTYDHETAAALAEANYTVVSGGGWFTEEYYGGTEPFEADGIRHVPNTESFVANWSTGRLRDGAALRRSFDAAYRNRTAYVQMLHYQHFSTPERRAELRDLIRHMQSKPGVRFVTLGELSSGLRDGTVERTADGWRVKEPASRRPAGGIQSAGTTADANPDPGSESTTTATAMSTPDTTAPSATNATPAATATAASAIRAEPAIESAATGGSR